MRGKPEGGPGILCQAKIYLAVVHVADATFNKMKN